MVDLKVAMSKCVAHFVRKTQRQLRMLGSEIGVIALDVPACFTDDLNVSNDCILDQLVTEISGLIERGRVALDSFDRFNDVPQVISQTLLVTSQSGAASAST